MSISMLPTSQPMTARETTAWKKENRPDMIDGNFFDHVVGTTGAGGAGGGGGIGTGIMCGT